MPTDILFLNINKTLNCLTFNDKINHTIRSTTYTFFAKVF